MNSTHDSLILQSPPAGLSLLPAIRALRLEICTRWKRPTIIPGPVLANVLRGALGITLRRLVCPDGWLDHDCPPCPLYSDCAYGQVFSPTPGDDAMQLRLQHDLPRPFVIEPPGLDPDERMTPDGLTFGLVLFGTATERLPYFVSTLDRLGHDGMGRDRVPFTVERITACHPGGNELLFTGGSTTVSLPRQVITTDDLITMPFHTEPATADAVSRRRGAALPPSLPPLEGEGSLPARSASGGHHNSNSGKSEFDSGSPLKNEPRPSGSGTDCQTLSESPLPAGRGSTLSPDRSRPRIKLQFLTPLLLKSGSGLDANGRRIPAREIRDRPPFGVIIRRLRDRLSALCTFFGEPWQHPDFASLGRLADTVTLIDSRTKWLTRDRRSTRTGQQHEISGLVGHATYEFPDAETYDALAPLLKVGELLHVGKHAPWGNGAVRCMLAEGAEQ